MASTALIRERIRGLFELYDALASELPEASLAEKLPGIPSNAVGEQLWCVVGARESFARAIQAAKWSGFACSLSADETREGDAVRAGLSRSAAEVLAVIGDLDLADDDRCRFVLQLLEHEAAHQGQLIRYLYGLRPPIPTGWQARYALT